MKDIIKLILGIICFWMSGFCAGAWYYEKHPNLQSQTVSHQERRNAREIVEIGASVGYNCAKEGFTKQEMMDGIDEILTSMKD